MNKTKIQTQSSTERTSLSLAHQRKNKKILSRNLTLYKAYTNHCTNFRVAKTKRKKESNLEAWEKETSSTIKVKKKKQQRNATQMKEQTRNTEVQINEEIGKLTGKEFRKVIVR